MVKIIEARVIQKVATEAEWLSNPLKLYQGEIAFVSDKYNFKLNNTDVPKTFAELEYYYKGDILGGVLPTDDLASKPDGVYRATISGTYSGVVVKDGYSTLLRKTGSVWSLEQEVKIPMQDLTYLNTKIENIEKSTINLFNKNSLVLNKQFHATTGELINSNSQNAITDLIPVKSNTNYGFALKGLNIDSVNITYLAEYDNNKTFIGYVSLENKCIVKTSKSTEYIRLNPNSNLEIFSSWMNNFMFWELETSPSNYMKNGDLSIIKFQNDLAFFEKSTFQSVDTLTSEGITFLNENLKITAGYKNLYLKQLFQFATSLKFSGDAIVVTKLKGDIKFLMPILISGVNFYTTSDEKDVQVNYFKGSDDELFIITRGVWDNSNAFVFRKEGTHFVTFEQDINIKVEQFILYLDENRKPRNANITQSEIENITNSIIQKVPAIVNQQIGNGLDEYLASHINDFNFLQPNYIQANSTFNFNSLTSAMNGKFISIIQDIDLKGATVDFIALGVKNLKLVFNGGRILNGKIKSYYTRCVFNSDSAFVNVEILNQFQNDFARPEWFGAKIDGVDGGIGVWSSDDSFAMNQALKFANKVVLSGDRKMIIKKPIILRSGNEIKADKNFEIKLGDASNCTLLKNELIDVVSDGISNPTISARNKNITIDGGIWNGNARYQYRNGSAGLDTQSDPIVNNTPIFKDGDGMEYFGAMAKFADIDNFTMKNCTLRDGRTYMVACGGLHKYSFENIIIERGFKLTNQDGIHIHGNCIDGKILNVSGNSGDDLIAVTTEEAGKLSVRVGDVKKLLIKGIVNYAVPYGATYQNPNYTKYDSGEVHRPIRLSFTKSNLDDIVVEDVFSNPTKYGNVVVISKVPNSNFSTTGSVGKVTLRNISVDRFNNGIVDFGANTKIKTLILENIKSEQPTPDLGVQLICSLEDWSEGGFENSSIDDLIINNLVHSRGYSNPSHLFDMKGFVKRMTFNNFLMNENSDAANSHNLLIRADKLGSVRFINSEIRAKTLFSVIDNSELELLTSNTSFNYYSDKIWNAFTLIGTNPVRVNSDNLPIAFNPSLSRLGDKILKSDGIYLFTDSWSKL